MGTVEKYHNAIYDLRHARSQSEREMYLRIINDLHIQAKIDGLKSSFGNIFVSIAVRHNR